MAEMTTSERDDFLSEVRVGVLAIERDEKGPLCAPVWYRYSPQVGFEIAMAYASAKSICGDTGRRPSASKMSSFPIGMSQLKAKHQLSC